MGVLDAFMATWSSARATFGEGIPTEGTAFDASNQLRAWQTSVESAAPGDRWRGTAADAYAGANRRQGNVLGQMADLDQRLGAEVDRSAAVVAAGRRNLDEVEQWVMDAASSVPAGANREQALLPIASRGLGEVADIIKQSHGDLGAIAGRIRDIGKEYQALGGPEGKGSPAPAGDKASPWPRDDKTVPGKPVPGDIPGNDDLWNIVSKSPTLNEQYHRLVNEGWRISFDGAPGKGTFTDRNTKTIVIDSLQKGNPVLQAQSLAHEFGHAVNPVRHKTTQNLLNNEGMATMNNIKVQREILGSGGPNIGIAGNYSDKYSTIYDQYLKEGSTPAAYQKAIEAIGNWYGDNEHPSTAPGLTYRQYYDSGGK